jgi:zinc finger-containing ubiquitin peptidase 1
MLTSFIIGVGHEGHETFRGELPTIFEIQDYIEDAWDSGINPHGRVETGGIRGTRKYIGTAEVSRSVTLSCWSWS